MIKELKSCITDKVNLSVFEHESGFHIGIDSTYLEQVSEIDVNKICEDIIAGKYNMSKEG